MTSTVATTVTSALQSNGLGQYAGHAEPVIAALENRDYQLVELITARVSSQFGVSAETVQSELAGIGMAVRPAPEPEPVVEAPVAEEAPAKKGKKGKKAKKDKGLEAKVNALIELAERHLGVSVR